MSDLKTKRSKRKNSKEKMSDLKTKRRKNSKPIKKAGKRVKKQKSVAPTATDPAAVAPTATDPAAVAPTATDPAAVAPTATDPAAVASTATDPADDAKKKLEEKLSASKKTTFKYRLVLFFIVVIGIVTIVLAGKDSEPVKKDKQSRTTSLNGTTSPGTNESLDTVGIIALTLGVLLLVLFFFGINTKETSYAIYGAFPSFFGIVGLLIGGLTLSEWALGFILGVILGCFVAFFVGESFHFRMSEFFRLEKLKDRVREAGQSVNDKLNAAVYPKWITDYSYFEKNIDDFEGFLKRHFNDDLQEAMQTFKGKLEEAVAEKGYNRENLLEKMNRNPFNNPFEKN